MRYSFLKETSKLSSEIANKNSKRSHSYKYLKRLTELSSEIRNKNSKRISLLDIFEMTNRIQNKLPYKVQKMHSTKYKRCINFRVGYITI